LIENVINIEALKLEEGPKGWGIFRVCERAYLTLQSAREHNGNGNYVA